MNSNIADSVVVEERQTPRCTAIHMLAAKNLHQCIWLPATKTHQKLRVTYSTTDNFKDDSLPAILYVGPMFGSRYFALALNKIAKEAGARVICVDRPDMGGSTPVPLNQRMGVWLETVPALLTHLSVQHVALLTHSAGTIYTLNTLYRLRDILHPTRPYVALLGPWVSQHHSGVGLLNAAAKLPDGMISGWSSLVSMVNTQIAPAASWSGGIFTSVSGLFETEPAATDAETTAQDKYGVDDETAREVDRLQTKYIFAEGMTGGNDEARLCLKKGPVGLWGECEDYEDYVRRLAAKEKSRLAANGEATRLRIQMFFAASDMMIGTGGQEYMEKCWRQDGVSDSIDVSSNKSPGTNHETIVHDYKKGALRNVFEEVGIEFR